MKKIHLLGIAVIAAAIFILLSTAGDASTYVDFAKAEEMAKGGDDSKVHVVGNLKKDMAGKILDMEYNPAVNANLLTFSLVDDLGVERKVIYHEPKPQDIEKSEKVVVVGRMENGIFVCDQVLLKCPSKYNDAKAPTAMK
ncbi:MULTISPECIES: cytochrome c maturation protein CcmE [unclassified Siphonobacter]|uniref:cytochrome c maturation protein CcmE domain-containing protein n=1 Tax=unclassified Siphonobacter TaxID=2635712 RepID=UPI000CCB0669|nr:MULTISPECIES: cytochrome c maturation protein CcmE [unclassified Siphonobacter]MDQ1088392.1 cytochrome c-type biogenesis protein CcmE [Siphonobacter sp. SORGH_AS_1065]MDR6194533.1 cytochrome c-type biogenesis protein CcmE [Siphonobacter sp. SORGH_AS_0500]PKK37815.1 cytochrome C biogenesis protein [Siphonobacter sp. SORGH_AS_0500]